MNPYPVDVTTELPARSSRLLAVLGILFGLKALVLLPSLVVLYFVQIAALIGAWFGYWIVLFTGRMPEGLHTFLTGSVRWSARTTAWLYGLTDSYPPFSLH